MKKNRKRLALFVVIAPIVIASITLLSDNYWNKKQFQNDIIIEANIGSAEIYFPEELYKKIQSEGLKWFTKRDMYLDECIIGYNVELSFINNSEKACMLNGCNLILESEPIRLSKMDYLHINNLDLPFAVNGQSINKINFLIVVDYLDLYFDTIDKPILEKAIKMAEENNNAHSQEYIRGAVDGMVIGAIEGFIGGCCEVSGVEDNVDTEWTKYGDYYMNSAINSYFDESMVYANNLREKTQIKNTITFISVDNKTYSLDVTPNFINDYTRID